MMNNADFANENHGQALHELLASSPWAYNWLQRMTKIAITASRLRKFMEK